MGKDEEEGSVRAVLLLFEIVCVLVCSSNVDRLSEMIDGVNTVPILS